MLARRTICVLLTTGSSVSESMTLKLQKYGMKLGHSRRINKTILSAVDEDIIDEGGRQSATDRTQKRGPDPVLTTKIEDCIKECIRDSDGTAWVCCTLPSVTDHCGHDAGSQITCRIDGKSYRRTVKDGQITVRTTCLSASRMLRQYQ